MKVRMLKTVKGSPNGIKVQNYKVGETYDVPEALLKCFIDDGAVELAEPRKFPEIETKEEITEKKRGRKKNEI